MIHRLRRGTSSLAFLTKGGADGQHTARPSELSRTTIDLAEAARACCPNRSS